MLKPSLEVIYYQNNDSFVDNLERTIESIYRSIDNKEYDDNYDLIKNSPNIKKIERLIKDRFNLNCVFDDVFHDYYIAAIIPFFSDYLRDFGSVRKLGVDVFVGLFNFNNIIKRVNDIEKEKKHVLDRIHNTKGYIDLKHARVGGYLAEIKHYLIFNFYALYNLDITPKETVAVILHELGHAFHGLETHHKLEKTNSSIIDILDKINNNKPEKALYVFKKNFSKKEFDDISLGSKKEIYDFYGKLAMTYLEEIKTQMINSKYDETNFENLADSFAARFNLYEPLVSSLYKLNKLGGNEINNSRITFSTLFIMEMTLYLFILALFNIGGIIMFLYLLIAVYGNSNRPMTYDFPIERYNRIKNTLVNNLKDTRLPKELTKDLLEQYLFIDEITQKTDYYRGALDYIADAIFPTNRDNNYYIKLQQTIESNLNNVLFVKSAQLRTI